MPSRLADRLKAARRGQFVGRASELSLFQTILTAAELPFYVLHIFGPGGVGKTSLLREFSHVCDQSQIPAIYIDARDIEAAPESFLGALQAALNITPPASPVEFLAAQPHRYVLLIDTYESLTPLDRWLRQVFLPQLPDYVLTVLAGREMPALAWRTDPGWQSLIHTVPLRNFNPEESQTYLINHDIPSEQHPTILGFTHGHPLALSLVVDMFAQRGDMGLQLGASPDMIKTLLERLVQKVPGPAHRVALEACAIVRVTTEALLAEMLALPDPTSPAAGQGVHELFEWLRGLSFIESSPEGLFPHDLIREILVVDLRWRNPDWYAELHRRARIYYSRRLQQTSGQAQQRILSDYVFLHRDNPVVRPFFEWQTSDSSLPDSMRETDQLSLLAMIARHEGEASADLAHYWFNRHPESVLVFRDSVGQPAGLLVMLPLHQITPEEAETDPAIQVAQAYLRRHAPLRPGEKATFFRFWLARDTYQAVSPTQSLVFLTGVRHYLTTPGLAFTFFTCAEPDFWLPVFTYADLKRLPEADFVVGRRRYGVYGHDWRAVPPLAWLALLAERETATEIEAATPPTVAEPLIVLSQPDFELAVREALRDFSRPEFLRANPLLRSRLVISHTSVEADEAERVSSLQTLLREAADSLQAVPREVKLYRALYHTYFQPAPSQEKAAELIDVPFSTFRRYLKIGVSRVTETLWQREIGSIKK
jgi:hypothetical protein